MVKYLKIIFCKHDFELLWNFWEVKYKCKKCNYTKKISKYE